MHIDSVPIHEGTWCNDCRQNNMRGIRYKCLHCSDFDLCSICYTYTKHDTSHCFMIVKQALQIPNDRPLLQPFCFSFGTSTQKQNTSPFNYNGFNTTPPQTNGFQFTLDPPQQQCWNSNTPLKNDYKNTVATFSFGQNTSSNNIGSMFRTMNSNDIEYNHNAPSFGRIT